MECTQSYILIMSLISLLALLLVFNIIYLSHVDYRRSQINEPFSLGIIDPYALQLHKLATKKEARWQHLHRRPFLNHRYYVHQMYKE